MRRKKPIDVTFNHTFRCIADVLTINNDQFHSYVDSTFTPVNLKLKIQQNHLHLLHTWMFYLKIDFKNDASNSIV
jgi:hypothetical protein